MYPLFVFGSLGLTVGLAWATYQSGRLLRSLPVSENLLLAPVENIVKGVVVLVCIGLGALSGAGPDRLGWTFDNGWRDLGLADAWPDYPTGGQWPHDPGHKEYGASRYIPRW